MYENGTVCVKLQTHTKSVLEAGDGSRRVALEYTASNSDISRVPRKNLVSWQVSLAALFENANAV